jgi:cytochrome c oxidase subunit 2
MLDGLFGRTVTLEGGARVVVDEAYIREAIVNPNARIAQGFQPVMPSYQGVVTEEGLLQLIEFVKSLREERQ